MAEHSSAAELCLQCQKIELTWAPDSLEDIVIREYDEPFDFRSPPAVNCRFCSLVLRSIEVEKAGRRISDKVGSKNSQYYVVCKQARWNIRIGWCDVIDCKRSGSFAYIDLGGIYTGPDSVLAPLVKSRPVASDPESEATNGLIDGWIQDCFETHPDCPKAEEVPLPTRIIDVGPEDGSKDPFLFIPPQGFKSRYLALSYCWGDPPKDYVLTEATLKQKEKAIPLSTLPKTIQDAIKICRRLKFSYLWIDALCIIQGGSADWEREAPLMGKVYSLATITISAGAASDSCQGIFSLRDPPDPADAPLMLRGPDGIVGQVFIRRILPYLSGSQQNTNPLSTRGWTFQEAIIPRRNLCYSREIVTWECRTATFGEGLSPDLAAPMLRSVARHLLDGAVADQQWTKKYGVKDLRRCWAEIVDEYSLRSLTFPSDRLAAIAGLARFSQTVPDGDEYLFGIWKYQMPWMLLWSASPKNKQDGTDLRPSGCAAPSWSWASVKGRVNYPVYDSPQKAYCQITRTSVTERMVEINGLLAEAQVLPSPPRGDRNTRRRIRCSQAPALLDSNLPEDDVATAQFDDYCEMEIVTAGSLWCLKVTGTRGLILAPEGRAEGCFKRVGRYAFQITQYFKENGEIEEDSSLKEDGGWFLNSEEQILRLV